MASPSSSLLSALLLLLLLSSTLSSAQRPRALIVPVTKDAATLQYLTHISQRTPLVPVSLAVDLGGKYLLVDCDTNYVSSTYRPALCHSALCSFGDYGCNNNTCGTLLYNPFISSSTNGELATDVLSLPSTDGSNPGPLATAPRFLFSCGPNFLLQGLANGAIGTFGLAKYRAAPPTQLAATFSFERKFAVCLPSSTLSTGVIFFGDGPYKFLPNTDASNSLIYTPLLTNPHNTGGMSHVGEPSYEYFIGVKSIRVNGEPVRVNSTLLSIDNKGVGGTKISTASPYTLLEKSIYKTVMGAFDTALSGINTVEPVAPFGLCYNAEDIGSTRTGPAVPQIDLVLQSKEVYWRIFGANSMVPVSGGKLCLGFVDGGEGPQTSIVIGGYQLEDNLLQFDLAASKLGFSSSLLYRQTTCSNVNFTSAA